jgi:hypothetical protein
MVMTETVLGKSSEATVKISCDNTARSASFRRQRKRLNKLLPFSGKDLSVEQDSVGRGSSGQRR